MRFLGVKNTLRLIAGFAVLLLALLMYQQHVIRPSIVRQLKEEANTYYMDEVAGIIDGRTLLMKSGSKINILGCQSQAFELLKQFDLVGRMILIELSRFAPQREGWMDGYIFIMEESAQRVHGVELLSYDNDSLFSHRYNIFLNATLIKAGYYDPRNMYKRAVHKSLFEELSITPPVQTQLDRNLYSLKGARPCGSRIVQVEEGSPAAVAGMSAGEIVFAVNGLPMDHQEMVIRFFNQINSDRRISITTAKRGYTLTPQIREGESHYFIGLDLQQEYCQSK